MKNGGGEKSCIHNSKKVLAKNYYLSRSSSGLIFLSSSFKFFDAMSLAGVIHTSSVFFGFTRDYHIP